MIQVAQLNVPGAGEGVKRPTGGGRRPSGDRRKAPGGPGCGRGTTVPGGLSEQPAGHGDGVARGGAAGAGADYLTQASTLPWFAFTHFSAAASGVILSTAMYLATRFWSSFVQLKFFTRS